MSDLHSGAVALLSIFIIAWHVFWVWLGYRCGTHEVRTQAVSRDLAHWICDNDGTRSFEWIDLDDDDDDNGLTKPEFFDMP